MSDVQKLVELRGRLVTRRRRLVEQLAGTPVDELTGTSITHIQERIDAVDRALADEQTPHKDERAHRAP